jgi:hypothetical protein
MLSEEQKKTEQPPAPAAVTAVQVPAVKITAHRKLTWRIGDDFETVESFIETLEPRDNALAALKEWLRRLDSVLAEEKSAKLAKTAGAKVASAKPVTPALAVQQAAPGTGDPYFGLEWSFKKERPNFAWIRVDEKLSPGARALCEKLRAVPEQKLKISTVSYELAVTKKDSGSVPKGTEWLHRLIEKTPNTQPREGKQA